MSTTVRGSRSDLLSKQEYAELTDTDRNIINYLLGLVSPTDIPIRETIEEMIARKLSAMTTLKLENVNG
jgi:hypothetical protein